MTDQIIDNEGKMRADDAKAEMITINELDQVSDFKGIILVLNSDAVLDAITPYLERLTQINIQFPSYADGRGFSLARALRQMGFEGTLRAHGHIIPDQFRHAMAVGFDDIAISQEFAVRMGAKAWRDVAKLHLPDYQKRLIPKS